MLATQCPTNETLHALSTGRLEESQSEPLLEHLHDCQRCRTEIETLQGVEDSVVSLLRQPDEECEYDAEPDCKRALARALGALAIAGETPSNSDWQQLPETIGEYEILRPLGRGGMGRVFLARHSKLGRQVALKLALIDRLADPRVRRRFEAEMHAVGNLSHPNIVTAHDAREIDGTAVLVTEYIDGLDLAQLVRRAGPLAIPDACAIICRVADALQYIADEGFVHRDVKPSNIMLSSDGQVKLLDLGLARFHNNDDASEMTGTGQAMGTADYAAPEQVTDGRRVDVRADIYSLGCTLFHLLTGSPPFGSEDYPTAFAKMNAHVSTAAPSLASRRSDSPVEVVRLVDAMLGKQPDRRPSQPVEVATRLEKHAAGADLQALATRAADLAPTAQAEVAPRLATAARRQPLPWMRRKIPVPVAIAAGLLGVFGGMALGIIITINRPDGSKVVVTAPEGSDVDIRNAEAAPVPPVVAKASEPLEAAPVPQQSDRFKKYDGYWRVRAISNAEEQPGDGVDHVAVENDRLHLLQDGKLVASGRIEGAGGASGDFIFHDEIGGVSVAGHIASNDPFAPAAGPFTGLTLRLVDFENLVNTPTNRLIAYPLVLPTTLSLLPLSGSEAAAIEVVLREQRATAERGGDGDGPTSHLPENAETSARSALAFAILVGPDQVTEATRLNAVKQELLRSRGSRPVKTELGTWYPVDGDFEVPVQATHDEERYTLVGDGSENQILWPEVRGNFSLRVSGTPASLRQREMRLEFHFTGELAERIADMTNRNLNGRLAVLHFGRVVATKAIRDAIRDRAVFTGMVTDEQFNLLLSAPRRLIPAARTKAPTDDGTLKRLQGVWLYLPVPAELSAPPVPAVLAFQDDRFFLASADGQRLFQGKIQLAEPSRSGELRHLVWMLDDAGVRDDNRSPKPEPLTLDMNVRFLPDNRLQMFFHQFPVPGEPISSDAFDAKSGQLRLLRRISDMPRDAAELAALQAGQSSEVAQAIEHVWVLLQATGDGPEADAAALKIRDAAYRAQTQHNLKRIGVAMQNFHDSYGKLPGPSNVRERLGEIHPFSWRVAILPFVENNELFEAYRFDQPWDGPDNLKLLERMPEVYRSPFAGAEFVEVPEGHTLYQGLVGPQTALGPSDGEGFQTFTDGTSKTLLIVESMAAVPWTKPDDIAYQSAEDARRIQPISGQPLSFVTADAVPRFMDPVDYDRLAKLITRNGGEPIEP